MLKTLLTIFIVSDFTFAFSSSSTLTTELLTLEIKSFERDLIRQRKLEKIGLSFLRFDDLEVKRNIVSALRTVEGYIEEFEKIHPQPLRRSVNQK